MYDVEKSRPIFQKVIKEFRDKTGLTQEQAAKAVGVRRKTISDWENGKTSAKDFLAGVRFTLLALREGVSVEDLIMTFPDQAPAVAEDGGDYQA